MSINLSVPQNEAVELKPRITVVGVGGAGGNAVNNMIGAELEGVEFIVANTDAQALTSAATDRRIQLGSGLTQGLGAGSKPEIGRAAAEESMDELNEQLKGSHMVFIAAGMGGGTGTGAAPVIARAARDLGVLTVGVVTKPFQFEGRHRYGIAERGIEELEQYVDTLIIIPNQNLFRVANEKTTFSDAFKMADDVLYSGVRGVTDLMVMPGLINLDFADVRSVMSEMGKAMMGTGEAEGERRALDAAEAAISNPLLDDTSMAGAKGVLINVTGGADMTLFEVDEAANRIRAEVEEDAYIIFGSTLDESLDGRMRVSVVATGIDANSAVRPEPAVLNVPDLAPTVISVLTGEDEPEVDLSIPRATPGVAEILSQTMAVEQRTVAEVSPATEPATEPVTGPLPDPVDDPVMTDSPGDVQGQEREDQNPSREGLNFALDLGPVGGSSGDAAQQDAFIPAPPVAPDRPGMPQQADPMAEAAMMNGAGVEDRQAPPVSQRPGLFARVTGGAKNKISALGQPRAVKPDAPRGAVSAPPAPAPQMRTSTMAEPILGGLEPEQHLNANSSGDDLLDIPAFLRRQAN